MLRALWIENFALIQSAKVRFEDGLTAFTGETGSGKSMLLGALAFVCGLRNDLESIGRREERTRVTLYIEMDATLTQWLREREIEIDPDEEATLEREILRNGKSSARICGRSASIAMLRELGERIVDFVGQHEAQRLATGAFQRDLLDRFGGDTTLTAAAQLAHAHHALVQRSKERTQIEVEWRTLRERERFLTDALTALDELAPQLDEYERMRARRATLAHAQRIAIALRAARDALLGEEASADRSFGLADAALRAVVAYAPHLADMATRIEALQGEVADIGGELLGALEQLTCEPGELEALETRAAQFERVARVYGDEHDPNTLPARREELREAHDLIERHDERLATATANERDAQIALAAADVRLCALRRDAATRLTAQIEREFAELALVGARFIVAFEAGAGIGEHGSERLQFTFAGNPGEPARPLAKIASGGERSRVMLALVLCLADHGAGATYVFDEVDAGIGGAVANAVGERLALLARNAQVLCVTHLAQIAVHAQSHATLVKEERGGATSIAVLAIGSDPEREFEIARMLSGEPHRQALDHAREMLARAAMESGESLRRSSRPRRPASRS